MITGPFPIKMRIWEQSHERTDHRESTSRCGFDLSRRIFMLGNLINFQDVKSVFRFAAKSEFRRLYRMLSEGRETRVREAWSHLASPESGMWEVPAVRARWRSGGRRRRSDRLLRSFLLEVHELTKPPRPLAGVRSGGTGDPDREDRECTPDRRIRHFRGTNRIRDRQFQGGMWRRDRVFPRSGCAEGRDPEGFL
ncbi:MAG: hypothetical protein H6Q81_534 [Deltaproteobacteria bacterium]|nr:hypothetical protein [Deltaproteobacteria bacterium]